MENPEPRDALYACSEALEAGVATRLASEGATAMQRYGEAVGVTEGVRVAVALADGELEAVIVLLGVPVLVDVAFTVAVEVLVAEEEDVALLLPVIERVGVTVGSATHQDQLATASAVAIVPLPAADTEMVRR